MLPRVLAKSASDLGGVRVPLELVDLPSPPGRLPIDGVLEPFDHALEMLEAFLQDLETCTVLVMGIGSKATFRSARTELNPDPFEHLRETSCPPS
jgi:hypothetical protein